MQRGTTTLCEAFYVPQVARNVRGNNDPQGVTFPALNKRVSVLYRTDFFTLTKKITLLKTEKYGLRSKVLSN